EAVRPVGRVATVPHARQVLLPSRMRGIEVTSQPESDVEVRVLEERVRERPSRKAGGLAREHELEVEEGLRVDHGSIPSHRRPDRVERSTRRGRMVAAMVARLSRPALAGRIEPPSIGTRGGSTMSWNGHPVIDLDSHIVERADRFYRDYLDPAYHESYQQLCDAVKKQEASGNGYSLFGSRTSIVEPIEAGRPLGRRDTFGLTRRSGMEGGRLAFPPRPPDALPPI